MIGNIKLDAVKKVLENDNRLKSLNISTVDISPSFAKASAADIIWNIRENGQGKTVLIEIKDTTSRLGTDAVLSFANVVKSNESNYKSALLVTTSDLTQQAQSVADQYNIMVVKVSDPETSDWNGRIREIRINMHMVIPKFNNFGFNFNKEQVTELLEKNNRDSFSFSLSGPADEILFHDSEDQSLSLQDVLNSYSANEPVSDHIIHKFEKTVCLPTEIGNVAIDSMEFDREISIIEHPMVVDGSKDLGFAIGFSIVKRIAELNGLPDFCATTTDESPTSAMTGP